MLLDNLGGIEINGVIWKFEYHLVLLTVFFILRHKWKIKENVTQILIPNRFKIYAALCLTVLQLTTAI